MSLLSGGRAADANERDDIMTNETMQLGNGETVSRGVFAQLDGTFLAMTFTRSRTFKTSRGAYAWLRAVSA